MSYKEIDFIFPFVVFAYGLVMTLSTYSPAMEWAEKRMDARLLAQFKTHRVLGTLCLWVGAVWSLQNLWFS